MKPAPFAYHAPVELDRALELLGSFDNAKPLAGGQSLVPAMNFRLAQPAVLVDLNRVAGLAELGSSPAGGLRIGAMVRQRAAERSPLVAERAPLLARAMPWIAHPQIRNRGTVGGSLAHADPASELPAVMVALQARLRLRHSGGARWVPALEFFAGLFTTALEPGELLVEIEIPPPRPRTGCAFQEVARRQGDYALAGAAVLVELDSGVRCAAARAVLLGVGEGPVLVPEVPSALEGRVPDESAVRDAAAAAAAALDPPGDIHASSDYRRRLAEVVTRRALAEAIAEARRP